MNDDPDDQTLLASVYLDNEATPDERALVETNPEAMAEVESLGKVRSVLAASTAQPSLADREAHLAAALDVFDRTSDLERAGEVTPASGVDAAAAAALTTPLSSSDTGRHRRPERRNTSTWMLSAAAGLLVLAGVGAVFFGVITRGNDDSTSSDAVSIEAAENADSEAAIVEEMINDEISGAELDEFTAADAPFGDDDVFDEGGSDDAGPAPAEASTEAAEEDAMADDSMDDAAMEDDAPESDDGLFPEQDPPATVPPEAEVTPPPPDAELTPLLDLDDLAAFATLATSAVGSDGESTRSDIDYELLPDSCENVFGVQERAGYALFDGETVQVGIDLDNRIVYAYTEPDCRLIGQTQLPEDPREQAEPTPTQP